MTLSQYSPAGPVRPARAEWWLIVSWGITGVLLGGSLRFQPIASALVLVTIVAVFWLIGGIVEIVSYLLVALSALVSGVTGLFGDDQSTARMVLSVFQIVLACLMLVGFVDVLDLGALIQAIGLISIGGGIAVAVSTFHLRQHAPSGI